MAEQLRRFLLSDVIPCYRQLIVYSDLYALSLARTGPSDHPGSPNGKRYVECLTYSGNPQRSHHKARNYGECEDNKDSSMVMTKSEIREDSDGYRYGQKNDTDPDSE